MSYVVAVLLGVVGVVLIKAGLSSSGRTLAMTLFSTKASKGASGLGPGVGAVPRGGGGAVLPRFTAG